MSTGLLCSNCGVSMQVESVLVWHDREKQDRFVDILYECPTCDHIKMVRYADEHIFCNFARSLDRFNYMPCDDGRECIFHIITNVREGL